MYDILHRIGIEAPPARVYEALTTLDGLGGWWTREVSGDPQEGGEVTFLFGGPDRRVVVEVTEAIPDRRVAWRCVGGPDEWLDTTMTFDLEAPAGETVVRFAHAGWREPVEFTGHCSTKWAYFLLGMKAGLDGGRATPFPDDVAVSSWG